MTPSWPYSVTVIKSMNSPAHLAHRTPVGTVLGGRWVTPWAAMAGSGDGLGQRAVPPLIKEFAAWGVAAPNLVCAGVEIPQVNLQPEWSRQGLGFRTLVEGQERTIDHIVLNHLVRFL